MCLGHGVWILGSRLPFVLDRVPFHYSERRPRWQIWMGQGGLKGRLTLGRFAYKVSVGATTMKESNYHMKFGGQFSILKTTNWTNCAKSKEKGACV